MSGKNLLEVRRKCSKKCLLSYSNEHYLYLLYLPLSALLCPLQKIIITISRKQKDDTKVALCTLN